MYSRYGIRQPILIYQYWVDYRILVIALIEWIMAVLEFVDVGYTWLRVLDVGGIVISLTPVYWNWPTNWTIYRLNFGTYCNNYWITFIIYLLTFRILIPCIGVNVALNV